MLGIYKKKKKESLPKYIFLGRDKKITFRSKVVETAHTRRYFESAVSQSKCTTFPVLPELSPQVIPNWRTVVESLKSYDFVDF